VNEAQLALSALDAYESDKKDLEATPIPQLKELGAEVLGAKYQNLSSWAFEKPDDIKAREQEVDSTLSGELSSLLAAKRKVLEDDLARELEKERLRLLFANQSGGLLRWAKAVSEDVSSVTVFGSELEDVEAYQAKKDKEDKDNTAAAEDKKAKAAETFSQAAKLGVKENPYTEHTLSDLDSAVASVNEAIAKRNEAYAAELARVRANDALAKEFGSVANPLVETVNKHRDSVNDSKAELPEQQKNVEGLIEAKVGASELKTIQELQGKLEAAGVTHHKHSHYTAKDVEVRLEQFQAFLQSKLQQIKENIALNASRGITADQLKEIERQFETFDKNKNKVLDKTEFKSCLYSLGEERPSSEVLKIMEEYGSKEGDKVAIPYEGFKKFMIKLFGDTNTQDEIMAGFKLLAHDNPLVSEAQLAAIFLNLDDVAYLKEQAPKEGDQLNYTAWTEAVFSR